MVEKDKLVWQEVRKRMNEEVEKKGRFRYFDGDWKLRKKIVFYF